MCFNLMRVAHLVNVVSFTISYGTFRFYGFSQLYCLIDFLYLRSDSERSSNFIKSFCASGVAQVRKQCFVSTMSP